MARQNKNTKKRTKEVHDCAAALFREQGYLSTTMNEIAAKLDIKKGSLYYYTEDKESLLFNILNQTMDDMLAHISAVVDIELSAREKLASAIRVHIDTAKDYLNQLSVLLNDTQHLTAERREIILRKRKQYENIFTQIVQEGIADGEFKKNDVKLVVYMILGSCNWIYQWYNPSGPRTPAEISSTFINIFFHGLLD